MPKPILPSFFSFDLADPEAARALAQEIADKVGQEIAITDESGRETCRVQPLRRNELVVIPNPHGARRDHTS